MSSSEIEWSSFNPVGNEAQYLQDAFASGWVSAGSYVEKLESELDRVYAGSHSFAVSNGTSALQLAFQTLGVEPGDQVIVPAFCFQAAGNILSQLGAKPVFCDIDSVTWNQTLNTIQRAVTEKVVGIVIVHNYGRAAPSAEIVAWAKDNGLWVIEDCAEAWFTKYQSRFVGQFGDVATFSMHATKTIASGEGGVVMINDPSLKEKVRLLRSHGLNRSKTHYMHELAGNNYRLSNLLSAVAYGQLEQRERIEASQKERAKAYHEMLDGHWALNLQAPIAGADDNVWAVAVKLNSHLLTVSRDQVITLLKERGIETRPGFYPASALAYNARYLTSNLPVSDAVAKDIIVLPCSSRLTTDHIKYVCEILIELLESVRVPASGYAFIDLKSDGLAHAKLERFVSSIANGSKSFRYFQNRGFGIVQGHDVSVILEIGDEPIGYGHIETENGVSWLGIAVSDAHTGKGWGKLIMAHLIEATTGTPIRVLNLKVDQNNVGAIKLYQEHGFVRVEQKSDDKVSHMEREIVAG